MDKLHYPIKNYNPPPARRVFNTNLAPAATFEASRQLLDWGAHQAQWQRPRVNLAGYLPVASPATPNTRGIRAVMFRDEENRAYRTPEPNKGWGLEYYPVPDWMGK